jgi:hypothetical protein
MIEEWLGEGVVIDCRSPFVCIGTLTRVDGVFIELADADLHDLRDTQTTRENYIVAAVRAGVQRNRKRVRLTRSDIVAITRIHDLVLG